MRMSPAAFRSFCWFRGLPAPEKAEALDEVNGRCAGSEDPIKLPVARLIKTAERIFRETVSFCPVTIIAGKFLTKP